MVLNDSVSTPSSSRLCTGWRRLKSPWATARVPSASSPSGRLNCSESTTASPSADNSASSSVRVRVSAYRRFNACRENEISW